MARQTLVGVGLLLWCGMIGPAVVRAQVSAPIDRKALVARHRVVLRAADTRAPLSIGNGSLAFTADVTGLQSYPEAYDATAALATLSTWAWHSFPNPQGYRLEDAYVGHRVGNREVPYADSADRDGRPIPAAEWLRANPHRLDLGRLGLVLTHADGSPVPLEALEGVEQMLDLWTGMLTSRFTVDGIDVRVDTAMHPDRDVLAVRVTSALVRSGRARLLVAFPYPSGTWDKGRDWTRPEAHRTTFVVADGRATFARALDDTRYGATLQWSSRATLAETAPHTFVLTGEADTLESTLAFTPDGPTEAAACPRSRRHSRRRLSTGSASGPPAAPSISPAARTHGGASSNAASCSRSS